MDIILEKKNQKRFYNNTFPVANPIENKQHSQGIQIPWNRDQYPNNALLLFYFFLPKNVLWCLENYACVMYGKCQPGYQPPFAVVADRFILGWLKPFLHEKS